MHDQQVRRRATHQHVPVFYVGQADLRCPVVVARDGIGVVLQVGGTGSGAAHVGADLRVAGVVLNRSHPRIRRDVAQRPARVARAKACIDGRDADRVGAAASVNGIFTCPDSYCVVSRSSCDTVIADSSNY